MSRQNIPAQPSVKTIQYANLLGVDYQSDSTEVSRNRSPEMVNMISDLGGNPIKRYGYRNLGAEVLYIFEAGGTAYAVTKENWTVDAAHPKIVISSISYTSDGELTLTQVQYRDFATVGIANIGDLNHIFVFGDYLYLFFEKDWEKMSITTTDTDIIGVCENRLYLEGETSGGNTKYTLVPRTDRSNIPTVYSMMKPNGAEMVSLPAGTDITGLTRGVNILTPFRRIEYCVQTDTVGETTFKLPTPYGNAVSNWLTVEILTGAGVWEQVDSDDYTHTKLGGSKCLLPDSDEVGANWFDWYKREITFTSAPFSATASGITNALGTASANDVPTNEPNLRITYAPYNAEKSGLYDDGLLFNYPYAFYNKDRCEMFATSDVIVYDGRLFVAKGNRVYYSRAGELFVIDDNYYFEVDSTVTGFVKTPNGLGVICDGSHPIYIASGEYDDTLAMPVYTVKASNANIEQVISVTGDALNDEPIVITRGGIYGISTNYLSSKYALQRSGKINKHLLKESSLTSAKGVVLDNYLYVAVGTHMYILDGRHKDASRNGDNSYECYYFDSLPSITELWAADGRLYFSDGTYLYTWNYDLADTEFQYRDGLTWDNVNNGWTGGEPVKALWKSPLDGDGAPHYYKTLQKKGTMVTISPPMQTSCQITLIRDAHDEVYVGRFDGSTFALSDAVLDAFTKKKIKKYKRLQFVVENNESEPFGLVSIVKSFVLNNYAKR